MPGSRGSGLHPSRGENPKHVPTMPGKLPHAPAGSVARVLVPQPPGMPEHWHHMVVCPVAKGKKKAGAGSVLACVTSFYDEINHV